MWKDVPRNRERVRRLPSRLAAALLLAGAAAVHALSTDSDQPIDIVADGAEHDDARRMTTYRGNVVIDQGSLHINADTVVVLFDAYDRVMKITSAGAPANFRQLPDGETGFRKAWARQMEYFPQQDLINLSGEARYEKDGSQVQAGPARVRFAQRALQGAVRRCGTILRRRCSGGREEAGTRQDPDQAEEETDAVEVRC